MIVAEYKLTQEHKDAGLTLGQDDLDFLALMRDGQVLKTWRWQYANPEDVIRVADKYLDKYKEAYYREKCDYAKHYEAYDWCNLSDNPCFKDTGECDEYNDFIKEVLRD